MAQIKRSRSDLIRYQSLLSSFSAEVHTAKSLHFHNKINSAPDMRNLFRTFYSLLCPPSTPPNASITADDFATSFTDKTKTISSQFSPPDTQYLQPTTSTAQTPIFSVLSPHWGRRIQTSPLQPSYNMSSRPNPLVPSPSNLSHTLTSAHTPSTHPSSQALSPRHSSRLGLPHC